MRRRVTALLAAAIVLGVPASAQAAPWAFGASFGEGSMVATRAMVVDRAGGWTVVWSDQQGGEAELVVRREAANGTLGPIVRLGQLGAGALLVVAAPTGAGAVLAWPEPVSGDQVRVRFVRIRADGTAGPVLTLAGAVTLQEPLSIAANPAGDALVAWSDVVGGTPTLAAQRIAADDARGPVVTRPDLATGATAPIPAVAVAADGSSRIAYLATVGGARRVQAVRLTAAGSPDGAGVPISEPDEAVSMRIVASEGGVGVVLGRASGAGDDTTARYDLVRLPSTGPIAGTRFPVLDGVVIGTAPPDADFAVTTDGALVAAFSESVEEVQVGPAGVRVARVPPGGSSATAPVTVAQHPAAASVQLATGAGGAVALGYAITEPGGTSTVTGRLLGPDGALGPASPPQEVARAFAAVGSLPYAIGADRWGRMTIGWAQSSSSFNSELFWRTAYFDADPPALSIAAPATVVAGSSFDMSVTPGDPGDVAGLAVDFGDGRRITRTRASHVYRAPGTYVVTATATDRNGNVGTATRQVVVTARPAPAPVAPTAPAPPPTPAPAPAARAGAALRIVEATRRGTRVRVSGRIHRRATGRLSLSFAVRRGTTTLRTTVRPKVTRGAFTATIRLERLIAAVRSRGTVTATYAGSATLAPATARRAVAPPKRAKRRSSSR